MVALAVSAQRKGLLIRQQQSECKLEIFYIKHEYSVLFFLAMDGFWEERKKKSFREAPIFS